MKTCSINLSSVHSPLCEIYKAYREELDKAKEARVQAHKANDVIDDYTIRRIEKTRKAMRRMKSQKRKARK